jgi:glutaconate CoA-transferase subunit A
MNKVTTMKEAVSRNVRSGDTVFISGAQHGPPAAAIAEITRQRIDHLAVITCLVGFNSLIGEGLVDKMITGYAMLDEKRSYALQRARAMNRMPVVEEYSHFGIAQALIAGYMGVPFMPTKSQIGSDMCKYNDNIRSIADPFGSGPVGVVKAVVPDVGILHVQQCDAEGNAQKWGTLGIDHEGINASKRIIVTTEKIVDPDVIRRDPNRTMIPAFRVAAVVEQAYGAYPSHLAGCYDDAPGGMMGGAGGGQQAYEEFLNDAVYGVKDWNEYLEKLKAKEGPNYFDKLKIKNLRVSEPIASGY